MFRAGSFFTSGLVALLALSVQSGLSAGADSAEQAIHSAYGTLQNALLKNNASAIAPLLAKSFQEQQVDGTIDDHDAYIKDEVEPTPGLTISSISIVVTKLTVTGQAAVAQARYLITGTYVVKGVPKPLQGTEDTTDRWVLDAGQWRFASSMVHDVIWYADGKLVQNEHEQLPPPNAAIAELRRRAIVIPTLDLNADPQQLSAIGAAIGDARIVGMGEGSHGSREFFAFKDRLYKYLVENKGFTVFAMEASWGGGRAVDRYIKGGPGTAQEAVAALEFWTWNTPEVVDLVQWMRYYNERPGQHPILSFAGFDMQDPMGPADFVIEFLRGHHAEMAQNAKDVLSCVADRVSSQYFGSHDRRPIADCQRNVAALSRRVDRLGDEPGVDIARNALTNVQQYLDSQAAVSSSPVRDCDMAENVEWLATNSYPRAKIALWAHNFHVSASVGPNVYESMGTYLRQQFGADYYTIGQTFGSGMIRAVVKGHGLQPVAIPAAPYDSIKALFGPLHAIAFVDLRGLRPGSALGTYFSEEHGIEQIGALAPQGGSSGRVPMFVSKAYDGLVYVPTSTAAIYGVPPWQMHRDVVEGTEPWIAAGPGFNDVTVSAVAHGAALNNNDGLNDMPNQLVRRFDAASYQGRTVQVRGEARRLDLFGFAFPVVQAMGTDGKAARMASGPAISAQAGDAWIPFVLKLSVPPNAQYIEAGIESAGIGSAEVRNVMIGG